MINDEAKRYLQKIKKLLSLAQRSTNPHEAASAMSKAQTLMQAHGITRTDVGLADINEVNSQGAPSNANAIPSYMNNLARVIAKAFGVKYFFSRNNVYRSGMPKRVAVFYGPHERPEIAAYAFDVLTRQLKGARNNFINGLHGNTKRGNKAARADQFCEGWVIGVHKIVTEFAIPEQEEKLIIAYLTWMEESGRIKTFESRGAKKAGNDDRARTEGYFSGLNAKLNQGVSGQEQTKIAFNSRGE
ncbi:DUF2786 domain-containing protein [Martelella alba]|uniref:DUF2786 domain-containing protein n=1 Tax=Martelella alba TaxID=2590451 RepID=A0ABY2SQZ9_9HYPH|nr:DUF2786 domain-containing protein [Martelella alba]TKI08637.1 DUF2786 domain-containing protein [Martelella alba]